MRSKGGLRLFLCALILLTLAMPLTASASGVIIVSDGQGDGVSQVGDDDTTPPTPEPPKEGKYIITIAAPRGWYTKSAAATVKLEDVNSTGFDKVEVRHGSNGKWQDVSDALRAYDSATVELSDNGTVYVAVTDLTGKAHMRSLYIECFDREIPTVRARIDGRTLRIEADDSLSGVAAVYVNGYEFYDLTNGTLDVRVKEYADDDYEDILVYCVDNAGNRSKTVSVRNPYYEADSGKSTSSVPTESAPSQAPSSQPASSQPAPAAPAPAASQPAASSSAPQSQGASSQAEQPAASGDSGSVTPTDGSGSVIENSVKTPDQREFFTITTERGNDYYIVVDKEKSDKNVYLLSEVTEEDLVGLTKESETAIPETAVPPATVTPEPQPEPEPPSQPEPEPEPEPAPKPEKKSNTGATVIIILAVVVFGVAAYYFKIVRPKQDAADSGEDEDDYSDDDPDYPEYDENVARDLYERDVNSDEEV